MGFHLVEFADRSSGSSIPDSMAAAARAICRAPTMEAPPLTVWASRRTVSGSARRMTAMRSLVSLMNTEKTSSRPSGSMARRRRSKISGSRMAEPLESSSGTRWRARAGDDPGRRGAVRRKRFFEDAVVAVEVRRRGGAHGQKQRAGCGLAEGTGQLGAGEPGMRRSARMQSSRLVEARSTAWVPLAAAGRHSLPLPATQP